jgi:3-demethoxyubiquinol 3-hydroxylase
MERHRFIDPGSAPPPGLARAPGSVGDLPAAVVAELRTDHAGEAGAVQIYRGILAITRDPALRAFALRHMVTEQQHLQQVEAWLPAASRSRLLPVWRLAGWLTGGLPAVAGPRFVYATIEAVERFVDGHYLQQIEALAPQPELAALRDMLQACRADELHHRDEAAAAAAAAAANGGGARGPVLRLWCGVVGFGSRAAVAVCRHV